jgi:hypothetical protein
LNEAEKEEKNCLLRALGVAALPACGTAVLVWWLLGKYTVDGYKSFIKNTNEDVLLKLSTKLSDGNDNLALAQGNDLDVGQVYGRLSSAFGKESGAPLIEAECFFRENRDALEKGIDAINVLKFAHLSDDEIRTASIETARLSEIISNVLDGVKNQDDYFLQVKRYQDFRREELEKEDCSAERTSKWINNVIWATSLSKMIRDVVNSFSKGD